MASMFSLFKRKTPPAPPRELSFKIRVAQFWEWYATAASRLYQTIESGHCGDLATEVSEKVNGLGPGFAWVFGPGANETGHSLTVSGEGNAHRQLLAAYWLAQAPKLDGWTFYSSRQPSAQPGLGRINIADLDFDPKAFWLTPSVNEEHQCIDLTVWHPLFPQLENSPRWTVLFLFLDEALGEIGTQNWIGKIEMNDTKLAGALPLAELRSFTERVQAEHDWKKGGPGELWTTYRSQEEILDQPRGDIYIGTTSLMDLIRDFGRADGRLEDPLAGTGADYVYVAFGAGILEKGKEVDGRGEIEDALIADLERAANGRHLGGAMGRSLVYIDLLLFDGTESMNLVMSTLRRMRLPAGTSISYFAHEKRGYRVVL